MAINNMRVIHTNIVDLPSTKVWASSVMSTATPVENLAKDAKSLVWRSALVDNTATTNANLMVEYNYDLAVGGVILPFTNLGNASIKVTSYTGAPPIMGGTVLAPTFSNVTAGCDITSMACNSSGTVVGVGTLGKMVLSTDYGATWKCRSELYNDSAWSTNGIMYVVFANNIFMAVGIGGRVATSSDGVNWTYSGGLATAWSNTDANALAYNNGTWVAGGASGKIATSTNNGLTWTNRTSLSASSWGATDPVNYLTYAGGKFVAVGGSATAAKTATSADGITWSYSSSLATAWGATTGPAYAIARSGSTYVVVGGTAAIPKAATSTDAITWTNVVMSTWTSGGAPRDITWTGSMFVVVGEAGKLATSPDGTTWTIRTTLSTSTVFSTNAAYCVITPTTNVTKVIIGGQSRVAVGNPTSALTLVATTTHFSTNSVGSVTSTAAPWANNGVRLNQYSSNWGLGAEQSSIYGYGGGNYLRVFIPTPVTANCVTIEITSTDPTGTAPKYIEASRLIVGPVWTPTYNTSFGLTQTTKDMSSHERTQSGDLITTIGPRYNSLSFDLKWLSQADRLEMSKILWGNGSSRPIFISLFPDNSDNWEQERAHMLYGKLVQLPGLSNFAPGFYSSQIEVEEI